MLKAIWTCVNDETKRFQRTCSAYVLVIAVWSRPRLVLAETAPARHVRALCVHCMRAQLPVTACGAAAPVCGRARDLCKSDVAVCPAASPGGSEAATGRAAMRERLSAGGDGEGSRSCRTASRSSQGHDVARQWGGVSGAQCSTLAARAFAGRRRAGHYTGCAVAGCIELPGTSNIGGLHVAPPGGTASAPLGNAATHGPYGRLLSGNLPRGHRCTGPRRPGHEQDRERGVQVPFGVRDVDGCW